MIFEPALGSIVAALPVLAALREAWPTAHLSVVGSPLLAEVLCGQPWVNQILVAPSPFVSPLKVLASLLWGPLSALGRFDLLLITSGSQRWSCSLLALLLPANRLSGYGVPQVRPAFETLIEFDLARSVRDNNLRLLDALGVSPPRGWLRLHIVPAASERVGRALNDRGVGVEQAVAVFVVETSGGQPTDWLPERMAAVAGHLAARHGLMPVFVGTAKGNTAIHAVLRHVTAPALSLAGQTEIPELAALCARASVVIAVDTGATHVAVAVGAPLVIIASSWQAPHHWLPLGNERCIIVSRPEVPCAGCNLFVCTNRVCMDSISAEEVIAAAETLLVRYPRPDPQGQQRGAACP